METGRLFNRTNRDWKHDSSGNYIFDNENMALLQGSDADSIHAPRSLPKLEDHLRTVLHSRYSVIPFHQTEFISVNYVYHGKLQIDFPDRRHLILQEGQLIFMNSGIVHSLTFGSMDDIVIGFQIEQEFLNANLLYGLTGNGPVIDFLIRVITGQSSDFTYLISGFEEDEKMRNLFEDIYCEYLDPSPTSGVLVENYMRIFFALLVRSTSSLMKMNTHADIVAILNYIETHPSGCSLDTLAAQFHFNPKYLGNLIHSKTGQSFQSILEDVRMKKAAYLLRASKLSVHEIAGQCGYTNMTFFFRHFTQKYGQSPGEYRS